jgi:hypothetical protein
VRRGGSIPMRRGVRTLGRSQDRGLSGVEPSQSVPAGNRETRGPMEGMLIHGYSLLVWGIRHRRAPVPAGGGVARHPLPGFAHLLQLEDPIEVFLKANFVTQSAEARGDIQLSDGARGSATLSATYCVRERHTRSPRRWCAPGGRTTPRTSTPSSSGRTRCCSLLRLSQGKAWEGCSAATTRWRGLSGCGPRRYRPNVAINTSNLTRATEEADHGPDRDPPVTTTLFSPYESEGQRFDSSRAHHFTTHLCPILDPVGRG